LSRDRGRKIADINNAKRKRRRKMHVNQSNSSRHPNGNVTEISGMIQPEFHLKPAPPAEDIDEQLRALYEEAALGERYHTLLSLGLSFPEAPEDFIL
jgi:hypothetical protein